MKTRLGLFATLLLALLALSGCDSIAAVLSGEPAPIDSEEAAVTVAAFKLYDSWASW